MLLCAIQKLQGHMTPIYKALVTVFYFLFYWIITILKLVSAFMDIKRTHTYLHSLFVRASPSLPIPLSPTLSQRYIHPPAHTCSRANPHVHAICSESAKTTAV